MVAQCDSWFVYLIRDPRNGMVVYVGITTNPKQRFNNHASSCYAAIKPMVSELKLLGLKPAFQIVLSGLTKAQAQRVEMRLAFLMTQVNRRKFLGCPVDVLPSKDRVCAIGPKPIVTHRLDVFCNGCGAKERLQWTGKKYKGPWTVAGLFTHVCPSCLPLFESDRGEFERLGEESRRQREIQATRERLEQLLIGAAS